MGFFCLFVVVLTVLASPVDWEKGGTRRAGDFAHIIKSLTPDRSFLVDRVLCHLLERISKEFNQVRASCRGLSDKH